MLFEDWLSLLLGFFRTHHLDVLNEAQDCAHLKILGQALEGHPHIYFWEHYQQFQEQHEAWDFWEAILDLCDHFLSRNTPLIAETRFNWETPGYLVPSSLCIPYLMFVALPRHKGLLGAL